MFTLSSLLENLGNIAPSGYGYGYGQMDWKETPKAHIFQVDLPGLSKNQVKLEVHQGRELHISWCREEEEAEEKGEKWHCRERIRGGSFSRQFRLPEDAKVDDIKASMQDGVLTVTVPKDEAHKKKKHSKKAKVEISGDDDGDAHSHNPKGLGRYVCCKA